jgi:hypothetical protein
MLASSWWSQAPKQEGEKNDLSHECLLRRSIRARETPVYPLLHEKRGSARLTSTTLREGRRA